MLFDVLHLAQLYPDSWIRVIALAGDVARVAIVVAILFVITMRSEAAYEMERLTKTSHPYRYWWLTLQLCTFFYLSLGQ